MERQFAHKHELDQDVIKTLPWEDREEVSDVLGFHSLTLSDAEKGVFNKVLDLVKGLRPSVAPGNLWERIQFAHSLLNYARLTSFLDRHPDEWQVYNLVTTVSPARRLFLATRILYELGDEQRAANHQTPR